MGKHQNFVSIDNKYYRKMLFMLNYLQGLGYASHSNQAEAMVLL
jgi:hypothetical protein